MSFKARKLNIDLTLDLTEYIKDEKDSILKTDKTDPESINEWLELAIKEGENLTNLNKQRENNEIDISLSELSKESKKSIIKQIDYFYNKGEKFYNKIPIIILNDIIQYINSQLSPVKKK